MMINSGNPEFVGAVCLLAIILCRAAGDPPFAEILEKYEAI